MFVVSSFKIRRHSGSIIHIRSCPSVQPKHVQRDAALEINDIDPCRKVPQDEPQFGHVPHKAGVMKSRPACESMAPVSSLVSSLFCNKCRKRSSSFHSVMAYCRMVRPYELQHSPKGLLMTMLQPASPRCGWFGDDSFKRRKREHSGPRYL